MEQKIKARIVLAHADAKTDNSKKALPNELILYDFNKKIGNSDRTEIRLRIGDGTTSISGLPDLVLDNMNFYDSEPEKPELGDVWYNKTEETFYLGTGEGSIKLSHVIENIEDGLGDKSIQTTDSSIAGSMCFRFDSTKTHTQNEFYLLMTDEQKQKTFNVKDKKFSMKLDNNFDYAGVATSLENGILKVQTLTATHNGAPAIPGTTGVGALAIDKDSFLFFPGEPDLGTDTLGEGAVALGIDAKAQSNASFAEGRQTVSAGQYAHAEGRRTNAIGYSSHAEGIDTKAIGQRSHAEGDNTIAEGYGAHAQGQKTEAIGKQSHAEGVESIAKGDQSHAEGLNTYTQGQGAHSEGIRTAAIGPGAHAEGRASTEPLDADGKLQTWNKNAGLSIAEGEASHIEGIHNHTGPNARAAHAEGELTEATGASAHAEGKETQAVGEASHAEGIGTIANKTGQHVQGKYNIDDTNKKYAHIVGNGTSTKRNNAHTLDWEGNAWYAGDIIAGTEDNQKDIIATGTLKGNSLDAITGEFNTINVGDEIKASIDENGNIISPSITTSNGNFENITVKKEGNNIINLKGETGEINTLGSIQAQGTGHFDNGLTVGGRHYGSNNYENPVLNYRGVVTNLTETTADAKPGDIVCIKNLIEQKILGFRVPKYENFEDAIGTATKRVFNFQLCQTSTAYDMIAFSNYDNSPYNEILSYLLNDILYNPLGKPGYSKAEPNTDILNNRRIKIDFGPEQKNSLIYIDKIEWHNSSTGQVDENGNMIGLWSYEYYGTYDENGKVYEDFKNYDVTFSVDDMPLYENIPENMKKYAVIEPEEISNYYLYDGKEWNDLTYNGKQLQSLISSHCMPTIGYSKNSKYKVNVGGENIVDLLKQAFNEGESVVYIESGKYISSKQYVLPQGNFTIIGLGDVNFNFVIYDNPTIKNKFIYTFNNITFSNDLYFDYITDDKDGAYYYNSLKANNCQFNSVISIWPEGEFNRCIFSNSIESSSSHYTMAIFNQCEFYNISRIAGQSFIDCKFYYLNSEIEKIFFGGKYYQESFNFQNCIFQLNNKNIKCCCNIDNNDEAQQLLNNKEIKNSSFLQYPFENIECIDEETCYINNRPVEEKEELLIQDIDKDFIQNASSLDTVVIEDVEKKERFPTTIALISGTENTPDGNRFDRYKLWKENKNFSYLNQISGSFIQGQNHFIIGNSFVTGCGHLTTGVLHTIEGYGNTIGGVEGGIPDLQLRANHAEGVNNILPSEYGEPQSRPPVARHIEGFGNIGNSVAGSHVQGYYCLKDENNEYIHIVGNGEDDENRSNAHTIDKNGKGWFAGGLTIGKDNRSVLTYNNEGHEEFPYPQINGTMFVLNQDIIEKDNNSVDFTDSKYADRIEEDEHGLWKIVLNKESKLYDILTVAINKIQGVSYEDIPLGMIFNPLNLKLELKNVSDETENSNILDFQDLQYITYYSDEEVALYFDNITTKLNLEYEQETELNPDTGEEEIIRKFYAFNSGVNKKVIVEGFYNYNTNDKYERGLYICTDNGWEKLIIGVNNSSNTNTPIISTLQSGPIILPIPSNATKVDNQYKFTVDLSKYGIKKGQTINIACVGAGGGGAGYSTSKTGGSAGKPGFSSGSKSGGQAGTGYGAGGGGCYATGSSYYSTGGGSGYVTMSSIIVEETRVEALVGIGGAGGTGTTTAKREGKPGGSTEFLGVKADGGKGGTYSTSKTSGGMGGNQGAIGVKGNAGGNGGNGWIPSNYDPENKSIQMYGVTSNDNVPTYSGDGAIFIWY